jgi:serine protease Do
VIVRLLDNREFTARTIGTDPSTDVAVIKIAATGLPNVSFGNSDSTRIGEWVLAIGNPLGEAFTFTVTAGIVSAKGRPLRGLEQVPGYSIQDFIQTDAAINPGNSGGPLVNVHGEVIGINSAIASETGYYNGYGFAIPINLARTVTTQLIQTGHVERAVMGIGIDNASQNDAEAVGLPNISGVVVLSYNDVSPARDAGIQLGDVIVALDGQPVGYVAQLQQRVGFKKPGETVEVTVRRRGGERRTFRVKLASAATNRDVAQASTPNDETRDKADLPRVRPGDRLGITVETLSQEDAAQVRLVARNGGGVVVTEVTSDGPAFQKLRTQDGQGAPDIILQVNGAPVRNRTEFNTALAKVRPGEIVDLLVLRQVQNDNWTQVFVRVKAR